MNLTTLSLAAAIAAMTSVPAMATPADDAFNSFRKVCGDTHDDYAAVGQAVGPAGWKPSQIMADTMKGVTVSDKTSRSLSVNDASLMLFATKGTAKAGGGAVTVTTCTVQSDKAAPLTDLQSRVQGWLGVAPAESDDKHATFRFTDQGDARQAVANDGFDAAASGAGMQIVTVKTASSGVSIDYVKIKK